MSSRIRFTARLPAGLAVAALACLGACGGPPPAGTPPAAPPAAATGPAAGPAAAPAASEPRGAQAVARAQPYGGVDLARCLKLASDDSTADEPRCPGFVSAAVRDALATCRDAGGRLTPRQLPVVGSLDVNRDGRPELIFALNDNYDCNGAPAVFDCGSLGCPYGIYEQRGTEWASLGSVGPEEATGLEVLARESGQRYAPLRGGCFGEPGCARITYFEWTREGYQPAFIDAGGYRVDFDPDQPGLLLLVKDVPVRRSPAPDGAVLQSYPLGTEMQLLGEARDAPYYYVLPCNACDSGFIEKSALGPVN